MIGRPTYASGQMIRSILIAPKKCQKTSDLKEQGTPETRQAGALKWKRQYDKEGDGKILSKSRRTEPSSQRQQGTLPVKIISPRSRDPQGSVEQARRRRQSKATEVSKPSSDTNVLRGSRRSSEID